MELLYCFFDAKKELFSMFQNNLISKEVYDKTVLLLRNIHFEGRKPSGDFDLPY